MICFQWQVAQQEACSCHLSVITENNLSLQWCWHKSFCTSGTVCLQSLCWVLGSPPFPRPREDNAMVIHQTQNGCSPGNVLAKGSVLDARLFHILTVIWMKTENHIYQTCRWQIPRLGKVKWDNIRAVTWRYSKVQPTDGGDPQFEAICQKMVLPPQIICDKNKFRF